MPIRTRLTVWYTAVLGLTLLVFGLGVFALLGRSLMGAVDRGLAAQSAELGRALRLRSLLAPSGLVFRGPLRPPPDVFVQVASPQQVYLQSWVVVHSGPRGPGEEDGLAPIPTALPMPLPDTEDARFRTVGVDGQRLRLYEAPLILGPTEDIWLQVGRPLTDVERALATLRLLFLVGGSLALAAAAAVGWWLAGAALAPIDRITRAAQDISLTGNWERRVDHRGPRDEVGQLANTFNAMLDGLQQAYNRLESAFQAQRHLLAAASHQLRTPLTVIRGNVDLLLRMGDREPEARTEALMDVASEAARLSTLVSDLLTLARADAGEQLHREAVALTGVLRSAFNHIRPVAGARRLLWSVPDLDIHVQGHPTFLEQLFSILLENAIRYTDDNGEIDVSCRRVGTEAVVAIRDNGIGFSPLESTRIFERFYRGETARGRAGAGLGLAIARWIAEQHGAVITAESVPGSGSTFTVRFPLRQPSVEAQPPAATADARPPAAAASDPGGRGDYDAG